MTLQCGYHAGEPIQLHAFTLEDGRALSIRCAKCGREVVFYRLPLVSFDLPKVAPAVPPKSGA